MTAESHGPSKKLFFFERGISGKEDLPRPVPADRWFSRLSTFAPVIVFDGAVPNGLRLSAPPGCGIGKVCRRLADVQKEWAELESFDYPWFVIEPCSMTVEGINEVCRTILSAASYTDNIEIVIPFPAPARPGGVERTLLAEIRSLPVKVACLRDVSGVHSPGEWASTLDLFLASLRGCGTIEFGFFPSDAHGLATAIALEACRLGFRRFEGSFREGSSGLLDLARFAGLIDETAKAAGR